MNKHLGNILPLFAAVVILVAVSFLVSGLPLSATTGPGERPPAGTVIPNFDGLVVRGDATVEEVLYVSEIESLTELDVEPRDYFRLINPVGIGGTVIASSLLTTGSVLAENAILARAGMIDEWFHVKGDITSGGAIGSFYTMETRTITSGAISATCRAGDHLTGCTAWSAGTAKYSYQHGDTCWARSTTNVDTMARARCFDPKGNRTGINP